MIETDKYYVSEIFESIQGEGNYTGINCLFIRFHFCNLNCTWCDTQYTWYKDSGSFVVYTVDELKDIISSRKPYHVIFTGGEPTLYRLDKLMVDNKMFHVESNGTIIPTESMNITLGDGTQLTRNAMDDSVISKFNWVISPKLSNSKQLLNENSIKYWSSSNYSTFKFVIKDIVDLDEIEEVIRNYNINIHKVYIGLEGVTLQSQLQIELVDEIVTRGFNFSPRLHVMFWGNSRGK